jgi:hypothetical protein
LYLVKKYARKEPIKSKKNDTTKVTLLLLLATHFSENEIGGGASDCKSTATDDRVRLLEL